MVVAFESSLAKEIGVKEAIVLSHLAFWVRKNEADERNIHDGKAWTFTTQKALSTYFDFLSEKQVRTTMANLKDLGLIETGNFNSSPYDKTTWYTLTERGKEWTDLSLRTDQMVAPIPYITTDKNKDKEKDSTNVLSKEKEKVKAPTLDEVTEYVRAKGYHFSPKDFFDYYDTANWHKADGKPVLNWKQCCVTWETKRTENRSNVTKRPIIDISDPNTYANDRDEKERLNKWD
ncbi:MAG: hypothetical protein IIY21_22790 [Clostridiales bacterium]|nr:hypothetical protein [Clostridiales bacterium]